MTNCRQKNDLPKWRNIFSSLLLSNNYQHHNKKYTNTNISITYLIIKNGINFALLRMCLVVDR